MEELFLSPIVSISGLSHRWNVSYPAAKTAVSKLIQVGILQETDRGERPRLFIAPDIIGVLNEASENGGRIGS